MQSLVLALSTFFILASPVLAIESHVVNVTMTLNEPVTLSATSLELAEGETGEVSVSLSPAFLDQSRCEGLSYRIIAEVEPIAGLEPSEQATSVMVERAGAESDAEDDASDDASLSLRAADMTDLWSITLLPGSADAEPPAPLSAVPSVETTEAAPALTAPDTSSAAGLPGSAWRVRLSVEIVGYRTPEGVVE